MVFYAKSDWKGVSVLTFSSRSHSTGGYSTKVEQFLQKDYRILVEYPLVIPSQTSTVDKRKVDIFIFAINSMLKCKYRPVVLCQVYWI